MTQSARSDAARRVMRIVIADDELLLREGLARLLADAGFDVVGKATTGDELLRLVEAGRPDVAIVDIKMPPTHTDEGLVAAGEIRRLYPQIGVLVLSHYVESSYAMRLLEQHSERVGYLLKDRVSDVAVLADALRRIAEGESVLDPTIVARLVHRPRERDPLVDLTERELEVLVVDRGGSIQSGDRHGPLPQSQDRRVAHSANLYEARARRSARRPPACACGPGLSTTTRLTLLQPLPRASSTREPSKPMRFWPARRDPGAQCKP